MSFADHLGTVAVIPSPGCVVCRWYASLDEEDRAHFDAVIVSGGSKAQLWRKCVTWEENPLAAKLTRFKECLSIHDRQGAARDAG